ncbi:MAG: recombination protein RecR [Erysipelotrichia bacterium]|jgi:recombination protein RecR|nr:recombination mediator RecR [Bacilli bacterium]MDD4005660.1 recombination mediator RecR [Bacilli bacterium]NMV82471.1 recombination protein RecR [Erysipelotrichia bacterium]
MKDLKSLNRLVESFAKLPSVGRKSAERMALAVLEMNEEEVQEFSKALENIKTTIHKCPICGLYTEEEKCEICADNERDEKTLIVVSSFRDVYAFEKLNTFKGRYHILGGVLSAVSGVSVEDLNIDSLLKRIEENGVQEIILATNPTIEGETTALFIAKLLEDKAVNITRLAYGLPMGGHVDYADSLTLNKALEGRRKL